MCGIVGLFNYDGGAPVDRALCRRMMAAVAHRGPDDEGAYFDDGAGLALGSRRLAIIDLAAGHQPMGNEDDTVQVVLNGEIYNFPDLRSELEGLGHVFRTRSDTEVIVHAWEEWELDALPRLNGMFAFALWDARRRQLVLARDVFGIKPLYFRDDGRSLAFASEIKALLQHPASVRCVDPGALLVFLSLTYVPSPATAFRSIQKLPPGHALVYTARGARTVRFSRPPAPPLTNVREPELVDELRERIVAAVKRQMISDVPVGALLSGGVDSSTVATLMTSLAGHPIDTFTVGFDGDFVYNELEAARAVARRIGSRHHEVVISPDEYAAFLPESIWHLEEPVATASTLAFFRVSELARRKVKVVLAGQGADEPFAGYHRHLGEHLGGLYRSIPAAIREGVVAPLVQRLPRNERLKRAVRSLGEVDPLRRLREVYRTADLALLKRLVRPELFPEPEDTDGGVIRSFQADVAGRDPLSQMLYVDARVYLADNLLLYGDKMSMAVSLEARVPFLDLELMEFVERIPSSFKIRGRRQKYILKKAVSRWLPDSVVGRRKIGFATPVDGWFRRELRASTRDRLLGPGAACREFFRPEAIDTMLEEHRTGREDHKRVLFSLLTFEIWHEQFIRPGRWPAVARAS
jgi:asparagine synthase (glutamine-hydrolysing)